MHIAHQVFFTMLLFSPLTFVVAALLIAGKRSGHLKWGWSVIVLVIVPPLMVPCVLACLLAEAL